MMKTIPTSTDISLMIDGSSISLFLGYDETPSATYELGSLVMEFLDGVCDLDGKVYEELSCELNDVIAKFEACLGVLKSAKL
jgi:hypothetical protein